VTTTNAIYRCEEFEDAVSVYDDIQGDHYDDLNENAIYLDIISEGYNSDCKPQLPSPRPVTESQYQNEDCSYKSMTKQKDDHVYLRALDYETGECDEATQASDQVQGARLGN